MKFLRFDEGMVFGIIMHNTITINFDIGPSNISCIMVARGNFMLYSYTALTPKLKLS